MFNLSELLNAPLQTPTGVGSPLVKVNVSLPSSGLSSNFDIISGDTAFSIMKRFCDKFGINLPQNALIYTNLSARDMVLLEFQSSIYNTIELDGQQLTTIRISPGDNESN